MTQLQAPSNPEEPRATAAPPSWRSWPLGWILLALTTLGLVAALLLSGGFASTQVPLVEPDTLFTIQKARNDALERELARMREALTADPCAVPGLLGSGPDKVLLPDQIPNPDRQPLVLPKKDDAAQRAPQNTLPAEPILASRTVAALLERSTVFIIAANKKTATTGSGFFVAPGVIATNRHVVELPGAQVLVTSKTLGSISPASIIAISKDERRDYALLRITPALAAKAPHLRINPDVRRTDRVSAWGFPGAVTGVDPKFKALLEGDVNAAPEVVYSEGVISVLLEHTPPLIVHTALISHGNSGGPLVNERGEVVGINTMIALDDKSYRQTGLSLAGTDLMAFMRAHGITDTAGTR